jgi:hypothetical protein
MAAGISAHFERLHTVGKSPRLLAQRPCVLQSAATYEGAATAPLTFLTSILGSLNRMT